MLSYLCCGYKWRRSLIPSVSPELVRPFIFCTIALAPPLAVPERHHPPLCRHPTDAPEDHRSNGTQESILEQGNGVQEVQGRQEGERGGHQVREDRPDGVPESSHGMETVHLEGGEHLGASRCESTLGGVRGLEGRSQKSVTFWELPGQDSNLHTLH